MDIHETKWPIEWIRPANYFIRIFDGINPFGEKRRSFFSLNRHCDCRSLYPRCAFSMVLSPNLLEPVERLNKIIRLERGKGHSDNRDSMTGRRPRTKGAVRLAAAVWLGLIAPAVLPAAAHAGFAADRTILALEALASKGSARAQYELALRYEVGNGVDRNERLALSLYCRSARQGNAKAAGKAGRMHAAGRGGIARDEDLGRAWQRVAGALGSDSDSSDGEIATVSASRVRMPDRCEPPNLRWGVVRKPPEEVRAMVAKMAPTYGLDPELVLAVIAVESGYRVDVVSNKNAMGLMQLIPETAERFGVTKPFDPEQNLRGGMKYLRWLLAYFDGNVPFALAGYNAGEGAVLQYKGIPPYRETQDYVVKIRSVYGRSRHPFDSSVVASAGLVAARQEEVAELSGGLRGRGGARK